MLTRVEMEIYFDKKVSSWNIIDYLESNLSKSFQVNISSYLKSLKLINESETGLGAKTAKTLLDRYKMASVPYSYIIR